ncbi:MAG: nucleoside 2-deoxyribosyltransferase [gamma proteobacterium symbiont of Bathyaustriella thionipta]|nr:nucleoside 2-deoxyribosyltransferase [gamma proteobacterium symbiont of Bathyaustriella thionipta]MCU7951101.1 nucleoside 2-deoxyribosyltransferase [gamma proteobacterium symbiont of Bathyaustriella thionipta]MCU7954931.1 nucleoside 2-deoxyribosyltransferase [gamma proteobacterium symbiont of Bathyaustriella thionipta]MCU7957609.1 nucleoside 2-deoxyribosyltransferase [gamma proteobacterium symbiont of Bathyaustriella thionipta]MCU7968208.1 nucleoside 2-deoxyribosyltransferase [gamma proteoba
MKTVYLAGPDVFFPDSDTRRNRLLKLCRNNGFVGVYPGDNDINPPEAKMIREANMKMIINADCICANLNPFRGFEPDSGTVFEVGFATALGKTVVGYTNDTRPMIERLRAYQSLSERQMTDKDGLMVENFGLPNNLMFGHIVLARTAEEAIERLKTSQPEHSE